MYQSAELLNDPATRNDPIIRHLFSLERQREGRLRAAEEARSRELAKQLARPSAASENANPNLTGAGEEACSSAAMTVGAKPVGLLTIAKAGKHGEQVPIATVFYLQGSCQQLNALDPMASGDSDAGGNWEPASESEERGKGATARPWRHLFDPHGQVSLYGKGKNSHLVLRGTMLDFAINTFSFPVGIFTTCKVSRVAEYPGFEGRIEAVQRSFGKWEATNRSGHAQKLSFVGLIPPKSNACYEEEIIYKTLDVHPGQGQGEGGSYMERLGETRIWVGRTYEEFKSGVINDAVYAGIGEEDAGETEKLATERLAYLRTEGPLVSFIDGNWKRFLQDSPYGGNTAQDTTIVALRAEDAYPKGAIPEGLDPSATVRVRIIPWLIVERALEWFRKSQAKLPFEMFENDRVYLARMDEDSWHGDGDPSENGYVSVKMQHYFTVVSTGEPQHQ